MKLAVHGAAGRMGQSVLRLCASEGITVVGAIISPKSPHEGRDAGELAGAGHLGVALSPDVNAGLLGADVVIDFSTAAALPHLLTMASRMGVAVVTGTTRLDATCERVLEEAAKQIPVLSSPNMSLGVHVLAELCKLAAQKLGAAFDIEIVETHHRAKVDSPSGTALRLAEAIKEARPSIQQETTGRKGNVGPRKSEEVGIFAVRGGDVIGDHTVHLLGLGERLELTHRATNRDLFSRGALVAARFLCGKAAGRYTMGDVLG